MITDGMSSEKRKCVVCEHKTQRYKSWSYVDGIEIVVPVCDDCIESVGMYLNSAMDAHLKAVAQSVRMSHIITTDENLIIKIRKEAKS